MSFVEKKFKRKLKNEKGSITIFVLTAMLFFLIVIAGIFIFYSNKAVNQEKTMSGIKDEYSADNIDEIYNQKTNEDVVIPGTVVERPAGWPDNETVTPVTDGKDNIIPIPDDFYYVGGTKDTGFVISDVEGDDLQNSKKGNQFVWVPVDNYEKFQRQEGYSGGEPQSYLEYSGEANSTGTNSKVAESTTTISETKKMYLSVEVYGGFYIGRFETGKNITVKKDETVYTQIPWSANGKMQETTGTTGGAVEVSRNFDSKYPSKSVTSTLCYGVQWDAAMNFIDPNYITNAQIGNPKCENNSYVKNSSGQGNYLDSNSTNNPAKTGMYEKKNIYDLAGNVSEWTMESFENDSRNVRGGDFDTDGDSDPASSRINYLPDTSDYTSIGFRISLFINMKGVNVADDDSAPIVTIKPESNFTQGNETDGYTMISFKLQDSNMIKGYELNGVETILAADRWSDINYITVSTKGAIEGNNVLIVKDIFDNQRVVQFKLVK